MSTPHEESPHLFDDPAILFDDPAQHKFDATQSRFAATETVITPVFISEPAPL